MINNTLYTSNNSMLNNLYDNTVSNLSTLKNLNNLNNLNNLGTLSGLNALNNLSQSSTKTLSYADVLKSMQERLALKTSTAEQTEEEAEIEEQKSTADMTMDEYKSYIAEKIKNIPFNSSKSSDDEIIQISNSGWQEMKDNPNYEQWVLGKITASRQASNQFALAGFGGSYYIMRFGDKESDYHEESWPKNFSRLDNFFSRMYDMSSLFGIKSKSKSKSKSYTSDWGGIFSLQAERLKFQSQVTVQSAMRQQLQKLK